MRRYRETSAELAAFGNALRDVLGLGPLYLESEAWGGHQSDERRFYAAPFAWPTNRLDASGRVRSRAPR